MNGRCSQVNSSNQKQTVLLIHGFCGSARYFEKIQPLFKEYHVLAPNLRGHSQPLSAEQVPFGIEDLAQDMIKLLDDQRIQQAHIVGHSMGGYIALALAELHPERVASLTLLHSTAYPDTDEGKANRLRGIEMIQHEGIKAFIDGLIPKLFAPSNLSRQEIVELALEIGYGTDPAAAVSAQNAMRNRPDRNHVLQQITAPILLIAGDHDQVFPPERVFSVSRNSIQQALIADVGHMSMLENPVECHRILQQFLHSFTK